MDELDVTRTAVTEQLLDLMSAGFVERSIEYLPGRGRPRHRYSAKPAALILLFASNQQLVVPAIWKAIHSAGGDKLTQTVLHCVSTTLLEHYRSRITAEDPKQRLEQYNSILREEGALVNLNTADGQVTITKRTCPFISMYENERNVCAIDLELMAAIAGCPVQQVACRHDGDPCCRFQAKTPKDKAASGKAKAENGNSKKAKSARKTAK
jgi:predicted ArsR family transcriptional regulator